MVYNDIGFDTLELVVDYVPSYFYVHFICNTEVDLVGIQASYFVGTQIAFYVNISFKDDENLQVVDVSQSKG